MSEIVWPKEMAQFVAYDARRRRASLPDGTTVTMRPQVYVRFYDAVRITSVAVGGQAGTSGEGDPETAYVTFDNTSVGLDHPFGASIRPDDPGCAVLQEAARTGRPVMVALETIRRARSRGRDGQTIAPITPIHALRGANIDGSGGDPRLAKAHCKNLVVMVEGHTTVEITSAPNEWADLVGNRAGDLPPEGWQACRPDASDWKAYGIVVPDDTAHTAPAPTAVPTIDAIDTAALRELLADTVREQLRLAAAAAASAPVPAVAGNVLASHRDAAAEAHRLLAASLGADSFDPIRDNGRLWALADRLSAMAERVDSRVSSTHQAQRSAATLEEAHGWLIWVIENFLPLPADAFADPAAGGSWMDQVELLAGRYYADTHTLAVLAQVEHAWDDADALRAAFATTRHHHLAEIPVAVGCPQGTVRIVPDTEATGQGWRRDRLDHIIIARGRVLTGQTTGGTR